MYTTFPVTSHSHGTMHSGKAIKGTIFETEAAFPFMEDNGSSRAPLIHEYVHSLITSTEYSIMIWIQFCKQQGRFTLILWITKAMTCLNKPPCH